jgi:hypothetical protein
LRESLHVWHRRIVILAGVVLLFFKHGENSVRSLVARLPRGDYTDADEFAVSSDEGALLNRA